MKRRSWERAAHVARLMLAPRVLVVACLAATSVATLVSVLPASPALATTATPFNGNGVTGYGDAATVDNGFSGITLAAPAVAMAPTPTGKGYWVAAADGGIFAFGDAGYYNSMGETALYAPVVGMAATPTGKGYWLVASDGGIFAFGDAGFYGSMGGIPLAAPVVGMAPTPSGHGYWLVGADGGIFAFGDAGFYQSMGGTPLAAPITGMAATPSGHGYWLVGADGGVFAFGDAGYLGGAAGQNIGTSVVGIAPTHDGQGYWLAAATSAVLPYGDAVSYGPSPNLPPFTPAAAIAATPDGNGYWLLQPDSISTAFSTPTSPGGFPAAVAVAAGQVGFDPDISAGAFCNPYGPCEEWCALFATWVWNQLGIAIPRYGFVGAVYDWAAHHATVLSARAQPAPGDGVLYGTGPQNAATSPHMAIVAEVWPDGAITTVDGDSGPEPNGENAVTFNGPFLPSDSESYNGMPIYAYVQP